MGEKDAVRISNYFMCASCTRVTLAVNTSMHTAC